MEASDKLGIEWDGFIDGFEGIDGGVLAEPKFHQSHENPITIEFRLIQSLGLPLPLLAEFSGDSFDEGGELKEVLFCVIAVEEIEVGVVEDFSFL